MKPKMGEKFMDSLTKPSLYEQEQLEESLDRYEPERRAVEEVSSGSSAPLG